jgi:hypothetical protein
MHGLALVEQCLRQSPLRSLPLIVVCRPADLLEQQLHQLLDHFRLSPEDVERLLEQLLMLMPLYENRMEPPVKVILGAQAPSLRCIERIKHLTWSNRQAGTPQNTGEMHDVLGEPPAFTLAAHAMIFRVPVHRSLQA